jgi:type IV pilus assembly protein PilY1
MFDLLKFYKLYFRSLNMTSPIKNKLAQFKHNFLQCMSAGIIVFSACAGHAAVTDLGTAPLVSATTGDVLPNLMYILDNSGSMASVYMPDYVNDSNKCKTTGTAASTANNFFTANCQFGDPAYNTRDFNSIYYNPEITYTPGVNADGSLKTAMTSANTAGWTSVPNDAYGITFTGNTTLVPTSATTGYPDRVWCNTTSLPADLTDPLVCRKNTQYIYPNNTGTQSTSFNQPYTARGYPYYYTVAAGEYCTDKNLTSCITATAPTATHTFPAKLRWCTSNLNVVLGAGCQAKYNETTGHTYTRWAGIATSTSGKIKINADTLGCGVAGTPSCVAPSAMSITNITVNGVSIILPPGTTLSITDTTSATQRSNLARAIRDAINAYVSAPDDFTATAAGDEVTIQPVIGAPTGTIALTFSAFPTVAAVPGTAPSNGSLVITAVARNTTVSIRCGSTFIGQSGTFTSSNSTTASTRLNSLHATINGSTVNGYTMTCSKSPNTTSPTNVSCTVAAPVGASACSAGFNVDSDITRTTNTGPSGGSNGITAKAYSIPTSIAQFTGGTKVVTTFNRVDIEPFTTAYPKAGTRTDCAAATTCTYDEEMTNFANWYSYYRSRMQMMKTSTSNALELLITVIV